MKKIVAFLIALVLIAPISAAAGSRQHHRSQGRHGHRVHLGYRGHYGHGYYGSYGHRGYYGHRSYYGHRGYYGHGQHYYPHRDRYLVQPHSGVTSDNNRGALALNVKPKRTEVYLDGRYIGVTGNYDGHPGYLWLEEGTYELMFYIEGYATVVREVTIDAGAVIDVRHRMLPGESVLPEELTSRASPDSESDLGENPAPRGE